MHEGGKMKAYLDLAKDILENGNEVYNERTGKKTLTVIGRTLEFDVGGGEFPLVTTRKAFWRSAIAEMLGYLRGYDSAAQFRAIGTKTWDANANITPAWLANPNRKGTDDIGRAYGVQGRGWRRPDGKEFDQLRKIYNDLRAGKDDRGEILTFWNPGEFDLMCLRPCIHTHNFALLDGTLYLESYMRSCDVPLGLVFNMPQIYFLLAVMAQITGNKPGRARLHITNAHIYEDQIEKMKIQVEREPLSAPRFWMTPELKTLEDLETWVEPLNPEHFRVEGYQHHPHIDYPFSA